MCYLFVGALCLLLFPFMVRKLPPLKVLLPFATLCILYLISAIVYSRNAEGLAFAARPTVCLVFMIIVYNFDDKQKLLKIMLYVMSVVAFVSITLFLLRIDGAVSRGRLQGTFQYANAAGIAFAAAAMLARSMKGRKYQAMEVLFVVSLLLTQSVGAIGCYILGHLLMFMINKKNNPGSKPILKTAVFIAAAACSVAAIWFLRPNALYTYLERLAQLKDSVTVMLQRPLLGIGAGNWKTAFMQWQTTPYDSAYMHSSIGQIGIDAGIFAVAAFGYMLYLFWKKREADYVFIAGLMILVHSLLDITLNFVFVNFLLIAIYFLKEDKKDDKQS